jgi:hypothetical protein
VSIDIGADSNNLRHRQAQMFAQDETVRSSLVAFSFAKLKN